MTDLIGYIAAFLTTASFLPQAVKTIRSQDVRGVSLTMYLLFVTGVVFWLLYGILIQNHVIIISNSITVILAGTVLFIKIKHSKRKKLKTSLKVASPRPGKPKRKNK
jgi:MtN3 and saliva related transmembrane protein